MTTVIETITAPPKPDQGHGVVANGQDSTQKLPTELPPEPDISHLVLEDETPVDNLIQEKLQRLLVQCLYSAYQPDQPFLAMADVGIFFSVNQPAIVPDVMLSLGVEVSPDWQEKKHRSYLVWEFGKVPEVVIEIVSNRKGNELTRKLMDYAQMGIVYYAVFDPLQQLSTQMLQAYSLQAGQYQPLSQAQFPSLGLGLTVWEGMFEGKQYDRWLRWCDADGNLLLTGVERAEAADQRAAQADERAEQERLRAEQLAAKLRELGINPETI
ncbi:MAG: Uma2 family endonuclease [Spirulina sp. SIO3F2]|nr:Uma2 family endonuclease [Spirulina sp. SIO3F2]